MQLSNSLCTTGMDSRFTWVENGFLDNHNRCSYRTGRRQLTAGSYPRPHHRHLRETISQTTRGIEPEILVEAGGGGQTADDNNYNNDNVFAFVSTYLLVIIICRIVHGITVFGGVVIQQVSK